MSSEDDKQAMPGTIELTAEPGAIYGAMNAAMKMIKPIYKDRENKQQRFNFRSVDDVYLALRPALEDCGVTILPLLEQIAYDVIKTSNGKAMNYCRVTVRFRFVAMDGSYVDAMAPGEGMDTADKATAKAMSVAYKTAMFQAFCIPCEEDERDRDGDYTDPMPEGRGADQGLGDAPAGDGSKYCSDAQLDRLHSAGLAYCDGDSAKWAKHESELAHVSSNGACDRVGDLSPSEADRAIRSLEAKLNERQQGG